MTVSRSALSALAVALVSLAATAPGAEERDVLLKSAEERQQEHEEREQRIQARLAATRALYERERSGRRPAVTPKTSAADRAGPGADRAAASARLFAAPPPPKDGALAAFHRALAAYERNRAGQRLVILQIGDSHTAGDHFTGYLRERFQRQFGDGGRGMLAAGTPYRWYEPYQVRVGQTAGWHVLSARFNDPGRYGLVGFTLKGEGADERLEYTTHGMRTFTRVEVEYLTARDGGSFAVFVDTKEVDKVSTRRADGRPQRFVLDLKQPAYHVAFQPKGDGAVTLLSVSLLNGRGGAVLVSHGVGGETARVLSRYDRAVMQWQLEHLNPALILVAFGTNEGFETKFKPEDYEADFKAQIQAIKQMAPNASLVVMGPPDVVRLPSWCGRTPAQREKHECRVLAKDHAADYHRLIETKSKALCYFHAPPALAEVRAIQARVAAEFGAYFWDWSRVMGGDCGMDRWARANPPLTGDRVHMKLAGYDFSAETLFRDLLAGYRR